MLIIDIYNENQYEKTCQDLTNMMIPVECSVSFCGTITCSKDYIVIIHKYLKNNHVQYKFRSPNSVVMEYINENKFDDLGYLYLKRIVSINLHELLEKMCYDTNVPVINYILNLEPKLNVRRAVNIITWLDGDRFDIIKSLLDYHATESNNFDWLTDRPLSNAAEKGNLKIIKLLVRLGAKPNLNNTAISSAIDYNHINIARILKKYGGTITYYNTKTFTYHMSKRENLTKMIKFFANMIDSSGFSLLEKMDLEEAIIAACNTGLFVNVRALLHYDRRTILNHKKLLSESEHRKKFYRYFKINLANIRAI